MHLYIDIFIYRYMPKRTDMCVCVCIMYRCSVEFQMLTNDKVGLSIWVILF